MNQITTEEEENVSQAEDDGDARRIRADNESAQINQCIHKSEVLHLDRKDHKEQNLFVGEHGGVRKEEGQIEVRVVCMAGEQAGDHSGKHADGIVKIEFDFSPAAFKSHANHIVEIQHEESKDGGTHLRHKDKGDEAPDLAAQQCAAGQGDHRIYLIAQGRPDIQKKIDDALANDNVFHQIGNRITAQLALQIIVDAVISHGKPSFSIHSIP